MRNHNMDIIRGVAVLGLMYMNAYFFGLFEFGYVPLTNPPLSDHIIQCFSLIFIDGRFRSLFCLLFGAGLYIQWQRWQSHEKLIKRLKILANYWPVAWFFTVGWRYSTDLCLRRVVSG